MRRTTIVNILVPGAVMLAAIAWRGAYAEAPSVEAPQAIRPSPSAQALRAHPAMAPKGQLTKTWSKVADRLRVLIATLDVQGTAPSAAPSDALRQAGVLTRADGRVRVTVRVSSLTDEQSRQLSSAGLEVTFASAEHRFAEGWIAPKAVEALAALDFVTSVAPVEPPVTSTGSVTSEGDAILRATNARQTFGVSGQGVKVGVISDSVDGLATAVASGDLPNDVQVLQAGMGAGEGTAMLEIVHDLAPGAALAFYGPSSSGDMMAGMNALAAAGAKVIVDDLTFFDQPHFEEGPLAQTVNALAAQGVVYATSSGNFASGDSDRGHYEAQFNDGGALVGLSGTVHAFGPGDVTQGITILPGGLARVVLQWGNRFGQAGDDYDLYVVDGGGNVISASTLVQDGNDAPLEAIVLDATGLAGPVTVFVIVNRFSGSPQRLELYYAGGITAIEHATTAGSIAGHANASGAITVATVNAGDPGNDDVAPYSSQGPCDLLFPSPETRAKPDVTGIDGVAVTGAAGFPNPFFGTSAAAPHVAAIAALMLEAGPALTPAQVKSALTSSAVDLGAGGFDSLSGAGRVDAEQAVAAGVSALTTPPTITSLSATLDGTTVTLHVTATDPDADISTWKVTLYDASAQVVGATDVNALSGVSGTSVDFTLMVTGVDAAFATAVQAGVVLGDVAQHASAEVRADFGEADPGGPQITAASFSKRNRKLKVLGSGLVRRGTRVEVNGATFNGKANRFGSRVIAKGGARKFGLRVGSNRIRAIVNGLRSNIVVFVR